MTRTQHKVLTFIRSFVLTHGYSPSLREIAPGIGINSHSSVQRHVVALKGMGALEGAGVRKLRAISVKLPPGVHRAVLRRAESIGSTPSLVAAEIIRQKFSVLTLPPAGVVSGPVGTNRLNCRPGPSSRAGAAARSSVEA